MDAGNSQLWGIMTTSEGIVVGMPCAFLSRAIAEAPIFFPGHHSRGRAPRTLVLGETARRRRGSRSEKGVEHSVGDQG